MIIRAIGFVFALCLVVVVIYFVSKKHVCLSRHRSKYDKKNLICYKSFTADPSLAIKHSVVCNTDEVLWTFELLENFTRRVTYNKDDYSETAYQCIITKVRYRLAMRNTKRPKNHYVIGFEEFYLSGCAWAGRLIITNPKAIMFTSKKEATDYKIATNTTCCSFNYCNSVFYPVKPPKPKHKLFDFHLKSPYIVNTVFHN